MIPRTHGVACPGGERDMCSEEEQPCLKWSNCATYGYLGLQNQVIKPPEPKQRLLSYPLPPRLCPCHIRL
ncbi:hypothetical protein BX600DRAFT_466508, partial [Xylariales sp. PMI_506]